LLSALRVGGGKDQAPAGSRELTRFACTLPADFRVHNAGIMIISFLLGKHKY